MTNNKTYDTVSISRDSGQSSFMYFVLDMNEENYGIDQITVHRNGQELGEFYFQESSSFLQFIEELKETINGYSVGEDEE
tara:strand:- start:3191 stop:3430 length:240 start_codon:yes stop_codon:yes gene_type:complete